MKCAIATIYVSDLDRAVRFYRDTLGLELTVEIPGHWAAVQTPDGFGIGLHPTSSSAVPPGTRGSIQIGFYPDGSIEDAVRELTTKGVSFRGPIKEDPPVRLAFFADQDGNDLYLCEYAGAPC